MFDWIPLQEYVNIYYYLLLLLALFIAVNTSHNNINDPRSVSELSLLCSLFLIFTIFYMGLRPVSGAYFGDMWLYNRDFIRFQNGWIFDPTKDALFYTFSWLCAQIMTPKAYFLLIDVLYILPMFAFSKRFFGKYWPYCFFMFVASFSFWSYGTNGLRNGLATSLFLLGLCFYNRQRLLLYGFLILSLFIHKSIVISLAAFIGAGFLLKKPKYILYIWIASIPMSLVAGGVWGSFFESLGLFDNRTQGYLVNTQETFAMNHFSSTGFRWDFLLYSAFAIYAGWYFIFKKGLRDKFYIHLFGTYAIANAFWILVIRAAFSNRFAYLSWFLMAPVIIYPLCKYNIAKNQRKMMASILFFYTIFTIVLYFKG